MAELNDDLLREFIDGQKQILSQGSELKIQVGLLQSNLRRVRGDLRGLRGEFTSLSGKFESMKGDIIVLSATTESLEDWAQRVDQALTGLTQLCKTNFDMNASASKAVAALSKSDNGNSQRDKPESAG